MYWNTVKPSLKQALKTIMAEPVFKSFRLVGGTSLSLQIGHRMSEDIDLFTDAHYGCIDFNNINGFFKNRYPYVDTPLLKETGMGASYYVGKSEKDAVKIDLYYTDPFIRSIKEEDNIRLASIEDIIAMKLDVIGRGGRKKDFWDLHALHDQYGFPTMIDFYIERSPYGHSKEEIRNGLVNFSIADNDFDPICLLGNHWELIKLDFVQWSSKH